MRRRFFSTLILAALLLPAARLFSQSDDLFQIEASISPRRLAKGQEGKVILKIILKEGVVISPLPQFQIEFNPSEELIFPKNFFTASDLEIEIRNENGRESLNLERAIEIPFTVAMDAPRGNHTLEGKIKYFACFYEKGWGIKTTARFSTGFYTLNRVYVKRR